MARDIDPEHVRMLTEDMLAAQPGDRIDIGRQLLTDLLAITRTAIELQERLEEPGYGYDGFVREAKELREALRPILAEFPEVDPDRPTLQRSPWREFVAKLEAADEVLAKARP